MFTVRNAIHVQTGQRALVEMLDGWLARHEVATCCFEDAFAACVHLLQNYEHIPDLALVGADWLNPDERSIVAYIRQTWPRTAIAVYCGPRETPRLERLPLTRTLVGDSAVRTWIARTPAECVAELNAELPPVLPARVGLEGQPAVALAPSPAAHPREAPADDIAPRELLTAEELATLLGTPDAP